MTFRHVFGPVPSRRLGISLGVDLLRPKTCSENCVYCECGPTTHLTVERDEYVPVDAVLEELDEVLSPGPDLDYVTFAGSGEPTLHTGLGKIASHVKEKHCSYKTALLTNGSLFWRPDVARDASCVDVVIASLDAVSPEFFRKINRPHPKLRADAIVQGLKDFKKAFAGELWIEVFILQEEESSREELKKIATAIAAIAPDRVQVNTLDRPGAESWVRPASPQALAEAALLLSGAGIISACQARAEQSGRENDISDRILATLKRRPLTLEDVSSALGINGSEASRHVARLLRSGGVTSERLAAKTFYRAVAEKA